MDVQTDIRSMLAEQVLRFVQEQYSFEQRRRLVALPDGFSKEHWKIFAELGWLMLPISEQCGGVGGTQADIHAVMHQFGRGMVMSPYLSTVAAATLIESAAPSQQSLLNGIASGDKIVSFASGEKYARYDVEHVATIASSNYRGYSITGEKIAVAYANAASHLIVTARTSGSERSRRGISLFLLRNDSDGASRTDYRTHDGGRVSDIRFDSAPAELIGPMNEAIGFVEAAFNRAAAAACAEMTGAMQALFEQTLEHLKTRSQFGSTIGSFQALQHRMVDFYMHCQLALSLALDAARAIDELSGRQQDIAVSAAKWQVGEAAVHVAEESIQLHGAMGMMDELPIGHYLKRITALNQACGDSLHHLARYRRLCG